MTIPTLQDCAARLNVDAPALAPFYDAAVRQQCEACTFQVSPGDPALAEALHRRVANLWASKAHTLGVLDTGSDLGVQYVPQYDPVIDALERHARQIAIA